MPEEYYKALGAYTHHAEEAVKLGNTFRQKAFDLKRIIERVTAAAYPFSEHSLPPAIDSAALLSLSKEIATLDDAIEQHVKEANLYTQDAKKEPLKRKDF